MSLCFEIEVIPELDMEIDVKVGADRFNNNLLEKFLFVGIHNYDR